MTDDQSSYSAIADRQLDELQATDPDLYNDILTICDLVFDHPGRAQTMSTAVRTPDGTVLRLAAPASRMAVSRSRCRPATDRPAAR